MKIIVYAWEDEYVPLLAIDEVPEGTGMNEIRRLLDRANWPGVDWPDPGDECRLTPVDKAPDKLVGAIRAYRPPSIKYEKLLRMANAPI